MSDVRAVLTEALAGHRPYGLDCRCGRPINSDADWARHMADVLLGLSGVAVIQLPEPLSYPSGEREWEFGSQHGNGWINFNKGSYSLDVADDEGHTVIEGVFPDRELMRACGAALVAAAVLSGEASGD